MDRFAVSGYMTQYTYGHPGPGRPFTEWLPEKGLGVTSKVQRLRKRNSVVNQPKRSSELLWTNPTVAVTDDRSRKSGSKRAYVR